MSGQVLPLIDREGPHSSGPSALLSLERYSRNLRAMAAQVAGGIPVWAWVCPVFALSIVLLAAGPALPLFVGKYAWTGKDFQEVLGPSLLGAAVSVAAFQCLLRANICRAWMLCIPTILLCRELHFAGTGTGVYLGLIAIVWFGCRNSTRLQPVWTCRNVSGCWFGAACFYALAVSVDSGLWKFLPHFSWWGVNLEETVESMGHLLILAGSLCGIAIVDRRGGPVRGADFQTSNLEMI
jgi:hypothetical protein